VTALEVRVRRVDLTILELVAQVVGVKAVSSIMTMSQTVSAITEGVAFLDIVTSLAAPVAHFTVVLPPGMYGVVADGDLSPLSSFALEIGSLVHVAINATAYVGDSVGGSESFGALVHGKPFSLKGFLENPNMMCDLDGFGMVGVEVLDFSYECRIVFFA